jgi:hypothetical protein
MSDETVENSTIRKYLLGDLPESEMERIERWYFAGGQAVDEVWTIFGEIAEERLSGALSENEAQKFEQRLRSSPALREMFETEEAIHAYAARNTTAAPRQVKSDDPRPTGRRQWWLLVTFFKSPRLIAAGAAALVAFGALGLWVTLRTPESPNPESAQQTKAQDQQKQQDQKNSSSVPQPSPDKSPERNNVALAEPDRSQSALGQSGRAGRETMATLLLLAGGTRSGAGEEYPTLKVHGHTETVQLELEPPTDTCAVFSAVLQTESGEELQRWDRAPVRPAYSTMKLARIRVRAGFLKSAGYVVRIECASASNNSTSNKAEYHFRVDKK